MARVNEQARRRAHSFWIPLTRAAFQRPLTPAEVAEAARYVDAVRLDCCVQLPLDYPSPHIDEGTTAGKRYSSALAFEGNSDPVQRVDSGLVGN